MPTTKQLMESWSFDHNFWGYDPKSEFSVQGASIDHHHSSDSISNTHLSTRKRKIIQHLESKGHFALIEWLKRGWTQ